MGAVSQGAARNQETSARFGDGVDSVLNALTGMLLDLTDAVFLSVPITFWMQTGSAMDGAIDAKTGILLLDTT